MRQRKTTKSCQTFIERCDESLRGIIQRAEKIKQMNDRIQEHLPDPLKSHVKLGNVRDTQMVLMVDAAIWSTRLRYEAPKMMGKLRVYPEFTQIKKIVVEVKPDMAIQEDIAPQGKPAFSPAAQDTMEKAADRIGPGPLKDAIHSLIASARRSK